MVTTNLRLKKPSHSWNSPMIETPPRLTPRAAKKWAYRLAADLLRSDCDTCPEFDENDRDHDIKWAAMLDVISELESKAERK